MTLHRCGRLHTLAVGVVVAAALMLGGCSSSPSADELRQLETLKAEVASMQKQVGDLEKKKADLEKELADLNAKTQKAKDDQQVVRQRLGK